jgi:hypothetical protein
MEIDCIKPVLRRSPRKFTPSLKAIMAMANATSVRKARVEKVIDAVPDTYMDYVETQLNLKITANPTNDPINHLESVLAAMGLTV